ncbi:LL-diaminopimelate aminotransferase [Moorena sp. SIO3H5]|uniref:LL-diaminopimelate aminotransferase n=1 Tax=Moorena sp. SIO3H5 TaxID=2607834 RepID=UPI0013BBC049|nr:LL-diaminopimelate aminotransferase [Moorena sp. SIO3H5]NEO68850.1 LL-diaminopimelate aminotransferase [Moorena sp. SIO3H5]
MASKNLNLSYVLNQYNSSDKLYGTVLQKIEEFKLLHPQRKLYLMTFGYTSQPLSPTVIQKLREGVTRLGDLKTYTSYEPVAGKSQLRELICCNHYQPLGVSLDPSEVFILDGAQSGLGNIQELFSVDDSVGIQNPTYPYISESHLSVGRHQIFTLDCDQDNGFLPEVPEQAIDLIYLCFPNNPTGAVATSEQLNLFVNYGMNHQSVIIFDAVYSQFVQTPDIPKSIYQLKNSKQCSIEINSFSKVANFAGLRLGWCVIPHELTVKNSFPGELNQMWNARSSIKFWGASNLAQIAGIAALSERGKQESKAIVEFYLKNVYLLKSALDKNGFTCFGGIDSPYIWVKAPDQLSSLDFFNRLLQQTGIAGMPGCLFGSCGEGYLRLSALGYREDIEEASLKLSNF